MTQESRPEIERELSEVRREVIEARNLVIKTDNLLKNLHAEVKMVGKRQEDFQRRQWVASGAAYIVFAALCVGFAWTYSSAKTSAASGESERLQSELLAMRSERDKETKAQQERSQASATAANVYRMMTTGEGDDRLNGIDALAKLDLNRVSPLERQALQDRASAVRKEAGALAFERGKTAFRRNDMKGAVTDLSRFLAMNPPPAEALDASFFLGAAHHQLGQHAEAVPLLTSFVNGDKRSKSREYGMLLLAGSLEATGQFDKAAEVAREALGTYLSGEFNTQLRARLSSIKRALKPAEAAGTGGTAPSAARPAASPESTAAAPAAPAAPQPGAPAAPPPVANSVAAQPSQN